MRIRSSLAPEQRFDELRALKNLLFFETLFQRRRWYRRRADRAYMHTVGIVALVCIALGLVPMSERNGSMRICFKRTVTVHLRVMGYA